MNDVHIAVTQRGYSSAHLEPQQAEPRVATIEISALKKSFGATQVLKSVSLRIGHGEFVSLLGPSGCGKTTLLRAIAGLEFQDSGEVRIDGKSVDDLAPKARDVAMVFQSYALYPYMTVAQNVALPLEMRRLTRAQRLPWLGGLLPGARSIRAAIDDEVAKTAESLGIAHLLARRPGQLSGGQRQRVALARAMVRRPAAFLMDEPLSNLDAKLRVRARAEIADLHRRLGATFVYVTHDQTEAMTMSDRVAVMMEGRIVQVAAPQTLYNDPADLAVATFVGAPEINVLPARMRRDGGVDVANAIWPAALAVDPGTPLRAAIRPEAWRLAGAGETTSTAAVAAQIRHIENMGSETLVHCALADGAANIVARFEPETGDALRVGQTVALLPREGRTLYFGADGTRLRETGVRPSRPHAIPAMAGHG